MIDERLNDPSPRSQYKKPPVSRRFLAYKKLNLLVISKKPCFKKQGFFAFLGFPI